MTRRTEKTSAISIVARAAANMLVTLLVCSSSALLAQVPGAHKPALAVQQSAALCCAFEPNREQADPAATFIVRTGLYTAILEKTGFHLFVPGPGTKKPDHLFVRFAGALPSATIEGLGPLPGSANYLRGSNASRWITGVPRFAKVRYRNIYPGIDLLFYYKSKRLEYDWIAAPGANVAEIRMFIEGGNGLVVNSSGDLVARSGTAKFVHKKPDVYQETPAGKRSIRAKYVVTAQGEAAIRTAWYDRRRPLIIDPVLIYSSAFGGTGLEGVAGSLGVTGRDSAGGMAVDSQGSVYLTGATYSVDFPITKGAFQDKLRPSNSRSDVFVVKLNPAGTALVYATYLGGSESDASTAIAVDAPGNAYVTGNTNSPDFPTSNPFQSRYGGGTDAFISKLTPDGTQLVYSTYLGGTGSDYGRSISVDSSASVYIAGETSSLDLPATSAAFQKSLRSGCPGPDPCTDAFVAKLPPAGNSLSYLTYLGGTGYDSANALTVDRAGNVYITGQTSTSDFPTTPGVVLGSAHCVSTVCSNGFVTKLNPSGSTALYSTYFGGAGYSIALDPSGNAYIVGDTAAADFPVTSGAFQTQNAGGTDAFVLKLNPDATAIVFATYLGGGKIDGVNLDGARTIAVDGTGRTYVGGFTQSHDFPVLNPLQRAGNSGRCASGGGFFPCASGFLASLDATGSKLLFSTYFGAASSAVTGLAVDSANNVYFSGTSNGLMSARKLSGSAGSNLFVTKILPEGSSPYVSAVVNAASFLTQDYLVLG